VTVSNHKMYSPTHDALTSCEARLKGVESVAHPALAMADPIRRSDQPLEQQALPSELIAQPTHGVDLPHQRTAEDIALSIDFLQAAELAAMTSFFFRKVNR
jgi:hypothetical protein